MKKWCLLMTGIMLAAGTAHAGCGSCGGEEGHKHGKAEKKAACEMSAASEKAECTMKPAECAAEKKCGDKAASAAEKKCCGTCKGGKKWYNPLSWFK